MSALLFLPFWDRSLLWPSSPWSTQVRTLLLIERVPSSAEGLAATFFTAGPLQRMSPFHKSLALGLAQFTHSTIVAPSHNCSFVCFSSAQRVWKNGMAMLQLTKRSFLLHERVSMCCMLCDNTGRQRIDNRIEGPRINKFLPVLPHQGYSGLNCIVSQPMHTGAGRGGGGIAEGQLPFLQWQSPLECLEDFSGSWKGAVNLVAMIINL